MAKKLNKLDLQVLTSVDTAPTGFVAFAAKSDGLYQKIGTVESKLSTTAELLDRVKTAVPLNAKFTDTIVDISGKVDKVTGKGLSTNDYTSAEKVKLNKIEEEANNYTHPASHSISFITGLQSALDAKTSKTYVDTELGKKENTFAKNTAFNRNFGTTAGTVSQGNHTHTFASLTNKPTTLSGFGITDAYTKAEVNSLANYVGRYSSTNGFLVKTDVARTENSMLVLHIKGNSYGGGVPINTLVQVYNYTTSDAIIQTGALNNGYKINEVKAFYYNNLVYFWVPQQSSSQTMTFQLLKAEGQVNRVDSVTNAVVPASGVEKMVTITPRTAWFENTLTKVSQLSNDSGYITASASITGNANTATTATKLGTATVGSTQLPFYLNAGTATAITQANLRKGLFGATVIGSSTKPVYIAANGVPTASTSFGGVTGIGTASPLMDGTVAVGTSTLAARQDHRHPVDTSRASVSQTMHIGTTAVAINRASATLNLTGIGSLAMTGALSGATTIAATTSITAPKVSVGSSWSLELSGTELQIKYGGVVKQRMLSDGTFVAEGEISALGDGGGGSSGSGGIDKLDSWANYTTAKANYYVPASLGIGLYNDKADKSNFQVVTSLPTSPTAGVFYFIKE